MPAWALTLAVMSGFLLSPLALAAQRGLGGRAGWLLALLPAALFLGFVTRIPQIAGGAVLIGELAWAPSLGVALAFRLDGLSLLFALLITGIGAPVLVYAGRYLAGHGHQGRLLAYLMGFMGAMLGLVLAEDLITLFVFWELTTLASFLLIGFDHKARESRRAALQALLVTGLGGLALLPGLVLLGQAAGGTTLTAVLANGAAVRAAPALPAILVLILVAAATKSAQAPFHFWLPTAMAAPSPVSAYLHSATMVKAGVYLLARLAPVFGELAAWQAILPLVGGATLLLGAWMAVGQRDLKLALAHTTVASLGLMVLLIGLGGRVALVAAMAYLLAHALFKAALFLTVGALDHGAGTRDATRLGGLARVMPRTFAAALLAGLSMAGIPGFAGFIAKEFLYKASLAAPQAAGLGPGVVTAMAVLIAGNALMIVVAAGCALTPFLGRRAARPPGAPHEVPLALWLAPALLGVLGLVAGLLPGLAGAALILPAAGAAAGGAVTLPEIHFGLSGPFLASLGTLALGAVLARTAAPLRRLSAASLARLPGPDRGFDLAMAGVVGLARRVTGRLQTGILRHYFSWVMMVTALAVMVPLGLPDSLPDMPPLPTGVRFFEWGAAFLLVIGGVAILRADSHLTAVAAMGVLGFSAALIFLLFGAPDLAFTQLMVETLSVTIIALVLTRLPLAEIRLRHGPHRWRDSAVAVAVGGGIALALMSVTQRPFDRGLSEFFLARAYEEAHGRNVVNVILVDFRALDTLGEIAVVLMAALACALLIRLRPGSLRRSVAGGRRL